MYGRSAATRKWAGAQLSCRGMLDEIYISFEGCNGQVVAIGVFVVVCFTCIRTLSVGFDVALRELCVCFDLFCVLHDECFLYVW